MDELRVILNQIPRNITRNRVRLFVYPTLGYYIILTDDTTILVTPSIYLIISPDIVSFTIDDEWFDSEKEYFQTNLEYDFGVYNLSKNGYLYITSNSNIGIDFKDDSGIISIQTRDKCIYDRKSEKCFDLRYPPELF